MGKKILAVNTGSSTKKIALFDGDAELARILFEKKDGKYTAEIKKGEEITQREITAQDFDNSGRAALSLFSSLGCITEESKIDAAAFRIVAPGEYFEEHRIVGVEYLAKLGEAEKDAPLHISHALAEIKNLIAIDPNIPIIGVSDSAFYKLRPARSKYYAIPFAISEKHKLFRFGYHGISVGSLVNKIKTKEGTIPGKLVVCHLGSGASISAVENGVGIDNSMGYTPLEGITMATRSGNIDIAAALRLMEHEKMTTASLESFLNKESGLLGMAGVDDMRQVLRKTNEGDENATLALQIFIYKAKKAIGEMIAVLGGVDQIAFSGGIGEGAPVVREMILDGMESLGIVIDKELNKTHIGYSDGQIEKSGEKVKVSVILTDELPEMARTVLTDQYLK